MRILSDNEVEEVSGGNGFVGGLIALTGAYTAGQYIGEQINDFNRYTFKLSFGEALYLSLN